MNYTVVINGALWLGAIAYYIVYARKVFQGPKMTVEASSPLEMTLAQNE